MPIRLLLTDDHQLFRDGLLHLVAPEPDITVVAQASNGLQALECLKEHEVDVVIMDYEMPELNGIETLKRIRKQFPMVRVIILSMHFSDGMVQQVLEAGAHGYVLKLDTHSALLSAIRTVAAGGQHFGPKVEFARLRLGLNASDTPPPDLSGLSDRETEVLRLIAEGHSSNEISELLFISNRTEDTHRNNLLQKLGAKNKAALVKIALRAGLVQ